MWVVGKTTAPVSPSVLDWSEETPSGDPDIKYAYGLEFGAAMPYQAIHHFLPQSKELCIEWLQRLDLDSWDQALGGTGIINLTQIRDTYSGSWHSDNPIEVTRYSVQLTKQDASHYYMHISGNHDAGSGVFDGAGWLAPSATGDWQDHNEQVLQAFGTWYRLVLRCRAASAVGANDGYVRFELYDAAGTLLGYDDTQTAKASTQPFCHLYITTANALNLSSTGTQLLSIAGLRIWDSVDGDDSPDVLLPWIHTAGDDSVYVKIIADRPLTGATLKYGTVGHEGDFEGVAANPTNTLGGRVWQWKLEGLERSTIYRWAVELAEGENTATVSSNAGGDFEVYLPADNEAYGVLQVTDNHGFNYFDGTKRVHHMQAGVSNAQPRLLLVTGDCFDFRTAGGVGYADWTPLSWISWIYFVRQFSGRMVSIAVPGNHDLLMGSAVQPVLAAYMPQISEEITPFAAHSLGCADIYTYCDFTDYQQDAACAARIAGAITDALDGGTRPLQIFLLHGYITDKPNSGQTISAAISDANAATLHALLASKVGDGKLVVVMHGHDHGAHYWVKDGVVYISGGTTKLGITDSSWGTYGMPAGDPGSMAASIVGYNTYAGNKGWLAARFSPRGIKARYFDSYCDNTGYHARKLYEQRRVVR
jgi:predicted phosphodiesterase